MLIKEIITSSPEETEAVGNTLAHALLNEGLRHAYIAMRGEMGVGKTAFARGFGRALGVSGVKSPTYTVVSEHKGEALPFFHLDLYRIEDSDDLWSIGYDDYLAREGYMLCEWSERIPEEIPADAIYVTILRGENEADRLITIEGEI